MRICCSEISRKNFLRLFSQHPKRDYCLRTDCVGDMRESMHLTPHAQKEDEHERFLAEVVRDYRAHLASLPAQHSPAQQAALTRTGSGVGRICVDRRLKLRQD